MILDREMQKTLLIDLRRHYPAKVSPESFLPDWATEDGIDLKHAQNLNYLAEHDLVEIDTVMCMDSASPVPEIRRARITSRGLDFLEDDGGLSAILGTVTVRLHADTIRDLIETRIAESDAPAAEKRRMVDTLKAMPEEGLKHLTTKLIDYGLGQTPGAWQALASLLD